MVSIAGFFVRGGNACGVMTIVGCLLPGVGADSRTKRFGNYTIGSRSQSEAKGLFTGLHRLRWGGHRLGRIGHRR
jgi:hypothetical protein